MLSIRTIMRPLVILLLPTLLSSCAVHYSGVHMTPEGQPQMQGITPQLQWKINELTRLLMSMGPGVDPREAADVAHDAYIYPLELANEWGLVWPPLYHNRLRNAHKRPLGLCYDWAIAMRAHMRKKNLRTIDLYWGIANKGQHDEHSSLVVTARGMPFESGVVLDPWRDSGKLYVTRPNTDRPYPWRYYQGPG